MTKKIEALAYVSESASPDPSVLSLATILAASERNNSRDQLTGALLHSSGRYFQVIEGDAADVGRLLQRLENDPRHRQLTIVSHERSAARLFARWTMMTPRFDPDRHAQIDEIISLCEIDPTAAIRRTLTLVEGTMAL